MENLTHALYMTFAVFVFIIAFTYSLSMVNSLNTTANTLVYKLDETNFYDSLSLDYLISNNASDKEKVSKTVGIDSIIPTLYRYYKESFAVRILDEDGNLMQLFDTTTEGDIMSAAATLQSRRTKEQEALLSLYGAKKSNGRDNPSNLYNCVWLGSTNKDTKERIDMYISGSSGYINNTYINYGQSYATSGLKITNKNGTQPDKIYLNNFKDRKFKETFSQYSYEGDTLTTEDDELISLTGTKQIATKIIITYELLP